MTANKTRLGSGDFARRIRFEQSGNISATDVQEAIEELDAEKSSTSHAHAASAITNTPAGGIAATDVQAALNELDTEKQPLDATLTSLSALGTAADRYAFTTGLDTWAEGTITAAGRAILDDADAAAQRTTLGLGALATQGTINDDDWSGTDLAVTNGGTGAGDAATAFTNLKQAATSSATGVVELATDAETQTGTDTSRAITPANLTAKEATATQFRDNTADRILTTDIVYSAVGLVTLTDGATIAVDMDTGFNFQVTLAGNRTLGNPTNTEVGQAGAIVINQDGTGSRTLAFAANWEFVDGTAPTLSTGANDKDILFYWVQSATSIIVTGFLRNLS